MGIFRATVGRILKKLDHYSMNGAAGEKQEAEKRIKEYIQASSMSLSKKEEQDFKELVIHNKETAKKVFRGSNHIGKAYILIYLNSQGKGADIAKEEAAVWVRQMEFINSNPLEEQAFRSWLSGETDIMPETMHVNKYIMGFPHGKNVELCYLSKVCTFTERLIVYGIKRGYVDIVRGPVKEMKMYSAIYAISRNAKAEKEFYRDFICTWLEQDQDKHLSAILPADSYEDKGVYTFSPYQVLPVQVQNMGAGGCLRPVVCGGVVCDRRHEKENGAGMKIKIVRHAVSLCWVTMVVLLLTGCNPTAGATEYEVIYPSGYSRDCYTYDEKSPIEGSSCYLQWEKADDYEKTYDYDIHILDESGSVLYRYPDAGSKAMRAEAYRKMVKPGFVRSFGRLPTTMAMWKAG